MNIQVSEKNYILTNYNGPDIKDEVLTAVLNAPFQNNYLIFHPDAQIIYKLLELKKEYYKIYILNEK